MSDNKQGQLHVLYNLLVEAGDNGVSREEAARALKVKESSVPVYFFWLKKSHKAEIKGIRQGKKIVCYVLLNPAKVKIPEDKRRSKSSVAKTKVTTKTTAKVIKDEVAPITNRNKEEKVAILDRDLEIAEYNDRDFLDIRSSLGLGFGSFGSYNE